MSSDQPKTIKHVPDPTEIKETLKETEREFFHKNFLQNSSFDIGYKQDFFQTTVSVRNERTFYRSTNIESRNYLEFSKSGRFDINGDIELDLKRPKFDLHFHRKLQNTLYSASISGDSDQLKNFKGVITSSVGSNSKRKFEFSKPLGKDYWKQWELQFTTITNKTNEYLEKYGISIVRQTSFSSFTRMNGVLLVQCEKSPQLSFGMLLAKSLSIFPFKITPGFLTLFLNSPKTFITLHMNNLIKPKDGFSVFLLQKYTKSIEVGALLESDSTRTQVNFGVAKQLGSGNLKFKVNDKLHCGWSYKWNFRENTDITVGGQFALTNSFENEHLQNNLFPIGIKIKFQSDT